MINVGSTTSGCTLPGDLLIDIDCSVYGFVIARGAPGCSSPRTCGGASDIPRMLRRRFADLPRFGLWYTCSPDPRGVGVVHVAGELVDLGLLAGDHQVVGDVALTAHAVTVLKFLADDVWRGGVLRGTLAGVV